MSALSKINTSQTDPFENVLVSKTIKMLLQNPKSSIKAFDSELHTLLP